MHKILIIDGSGHYSFGISRSLSYCREYQLHLMIASDDHLSRCLKYAHCHVFDHMDDSKKHLDEIISIVKENNIDFLFAGGDKGIRFLIDHQNILNEFCQLPSFPDEDIFEIARNKARLSEYVVEKQLAHPKTVLYRSESDIDNLAQLTFPVLLKQPDEVGGRGIKKFADVEALTAYLKTLELKNEILCQEFIEGRDIGVNVICKDGEILVHTMQRALIDNPREYGPSLAVEFVENENALNEVARLMKLFNWQGVAQIDMRLNEETGEVYIIEVNPRFWSSLIASLTAGANFSWLYCEIMLNNKNWYSSYKKVQYIQVKTLREIFKGKHRLLSKVRWLSVRTAVSYHFYGLRRVLSLKH